jgi:hypothetical protein
MTLFHLFLRKSFLLPLSTRAFSRLMWASLLFFFCFIKEACREPIAAGLLSRRR